MGLLKLLLLRGTGFLLNYVIFHVPLHLLSLILVSMYFVFLLLSVSEISKLISFTFLFLLSLTAYRLPFDGYLRILPGFVASSHCHFAIIYHHVTQCSLCCLT
jgi:hypothetical protein